MQQDIKKELKDRVQSLIEWTPILGNYLLKKKCNMLEEYMYETFYDQLTGLYNRKKVIELSKAESLRVARYDYPLSLLMLDVDNFKKINDNYGHLMGDKILKEMGSLIKGAVRQMDVPGRYGGDEFILLFPHTPHNKAKIAGEKIGNAVAGHKFKDYDKNITVSIGLTDIDTAFQSYKNEIIDKISKPGDINLENKLTNFVDKLISCADKALYDAKHAGKNRVCVYGFA